MESFRRQRKKLLAKENKGLFQATSPFLVGVKEQEGYSLCSYLTGIETAVKSWFAVMGQEILFLTCYFFLICPCYFLFY